MKNQEGFKNNNNGQGQSKSDRAFTNQNEKLKERGIGNSGGSVPTKHPINTPLTNPSTKKINGFNNDPAELPGRFL